MLSVKVSALIPTRNRPDEVQPLLHNLSEREYSPFEFIVVEASDDRKTEDIVREFGFEGTGLKIRYFRAPDRGLTKQRNFGISRSTGQGILMLDDDILLNK